MLPSATHMPPHESKEAAQRHERTDQSQQCLQSYLIYSYMKIPHIAYPNVSDEESIFRLVKIFFNELIILKRLYIELPK